jgi:hypothetical protein
MRTTRILSLATLLSISTPGCGPAGVGSQPDGGPRDAGAVGPDAGVVAPDGGTIGPDAGIVAPDASTTAPDGGTVGPDAGTLGPDGGTLVPAFYVATNGLDTNAGTLEQPFATLAKAQSAMRASSTIKTTYIRAGTYSPPSVAGNCVWGNAAGSSISLTSSDSGETWSYYPPDGFGSAILDGQSTLGTSGPTGGNGTGCGFGAVEATDVTIVGLQFENYRYAAFWGYEASNLTFTDNTIHDVTGACWGTGAIFLANSSGAEITNNYMHDIAYPGTAVEDNAQDGGGTSNITIANNIILNSCTWPADRDGGGNDQNGGDCGAIYFAGRNTPSSNRLVLNNYIRDVNASSGGAGDFGHCCAFGIYLDDGSNDVTSRGNVVSGTTSGCFYINGGEDMSLEGNLCDLGDVGTQTIVLYGNHNTPMINNVFSNNIVVSGAGGAGNGYWSQNSPPTPLSISDNLYFNYVGTSINTTVTGKNPGAGDTNPTYANPEISCWAADIASASPAFNAPVNFVPLHGGWGPPGFLDPMSGTPPSWPHACQ